MAERIESKNQDLSNIPGSSSATLDHTYGKTEARQNDRISIQNSHSSENNDRAFSPRKSSHSEDACAIYRSNLEYLYRKGGSGGGDEYLDSLSPLSGFQGHHTIREHREIPRGNSEPVVSDDNRIDADNTQDRGRMSRQRNRKGNSDRQKKTEASEHGILPRSTRQGGAKQQREASAESAQQPMDLTFRPKTMKRDNQNIAKSEAISDDSSQPLNLSLNLHKSQSNTHIDPVRIIRHPNLARNQQNMPNDPRSTARNQFDLQFIQGNQQFGTPQLVHRNLPNVQQLNPQNIQGNLPNVQQVNPQNIQENLPNVQQVNPQNIQGNLPNVHQLNPQNIQRNLPNVQQVNPQNIQRNLPNVQQLNPQNIQRNLPNVQQLNPQNIQRNRTDVQQLNPQNIQRNLPNVQQLHLQNIQRHLLNVQQLNPQNTQRNLLNVHQLNLQNMQKNLPNVHQLNPQTSQRNRTYDHQENPQNIQRNPVVPRSGREQVPKHWGVLPDPRGLPLPLNQLFPSQFNTPGSNLPDGSTAHYSVQNPPSQSLQSPHPTVRQLYPHPSFLAHPTNTAMQGNTRRYEHHEGRMPGNVLHPTGQYGSQNVVDNLWGSHPRHILNSGVSGNFNASLAEPSFRNAFPPQPHNYLPHPFNRSLPDLPSRSLLHQQSQPPTSPWNPPVDRADLKRSVNPTHQETSFGQTKTARYIEPGVNRLPNSFESSSSRVTSTSNDWSLAYDTPSMEQTGIVFRTPQRTFPTIPRPPAVIQRNSLDDVLVKALSEPYTAPIPPLPSDSDSRDVQIWMLCLHEEQTLCLGLLEEMLYFLLIPIKRDFANSQKYPRRLKDNQEKVENVFEHVLTYVHLARNAISRSKHSAHWKKELLHSLKTFLLFLEEYLEDIEQIVQHFASD